MICVCRFSKKLLIPLFIVGLCVVGSGAVFAAEVRNSVTGTIGRNNSTATTQQTAVTPKNTAEEVTSAVPVAVEFTGKDVLGAKLSTQLKEQLAGSRLLHLTTGQRPKIIISLQTTPEFESRPSVGSAYSIVWLFSEKPTSFSLYLESEVGVVTADSVADLTALLIERTLAVAGKHPYLFK